MIGLVIGLWLLSGSASFVYWWTKIDDLKVDALGLVLASSIGGPTMFLWLWLAFSSVNEKVLIKRRSSKG